MRARSHNTRILLGQKPFAGGPGASLYVGTPDGPAIRYRRLKPVGPGSIWHPKTTTATIDPGADSVDKTQRVATVDSPDDQMTYTLPAALLGVPVACQVRTFQDHYENETIYRPVIVGVDGDGDQADTILGTVAVLRVAKLDDGGMLVAFAYTPSPSGLQPAEFAVVKTAGSGTVADVVADANGLRVQEIQVDGLTNGVDYVFDLEGRVDAVEQVLASFTFTADAAGPASPTVTAVAY